MPSNRDENIRQRAYELWERDGAQHGRDQDYWHEAVEQIDAEERAEKSPKSAPARKRKATKAQAFEGDEAERGSAHADDASAGVAPKKRGRPRKTDAGGSMTAPARRPPQASKPGKE